mmetsp:Transcript_53026/g.126764  ORF Transcript_53026/g.126764 Transcript_53026/m.126764 type:complete len:277 (-) Transcript_53026:643-1473(-)
MIRRLANHQLTILEAEDAGGLAVPEGVGQHLHALVLPDGGTAIAGAQINAADRASNARWRRRREEEIEARRRSFLLQWHLDGHQHVAAAAHSCHAEVSGDGLPLTRSMLCLRCTGSALCSLLRRFSAGRPRLFRHPTGFQGLRRLRAFLKGFCSFPRLCGSFCSGHGRLRGSSRRFAALFLAAAHPMASALRLQPSPRDATICLDVMQEEPLITRALLLQGRPLRGAEKDQILRIFLRPGLVVVSFGAEFHTSVLQDGKEGCLEPDAHRIVGFQIR